MPENEENQSNPQPPPTEANAADSQAELLSDADFLAALNEVAKLEQSSESEEAPGPESSEQEEPAPTEETPDAVEPVAADPASTDDPVAVEPAESAPVATEPVQGTEEPAGAAPTADPPPPVDTEPAADTEPGPDEPMPSAEPEVGEAPPAVADTPVPVPAASETETLGDADLMAALQEVEMQSNDPFGGDSLSDAFASANFDDAAPAPAPEMEEGAALSEEDAATEAAASDDSADANNPGVLTEPPEGASGVGPGGVPKAMSFQLGAKKVGAPSPQPETSTAEATSPTPKPGRALLPVASIGKRIYRAIDGLLDLMHRPFSKLSGSTRTLIGYCALATLVMSAISVTLLPLLVQRRDAIAFLLEKRAALDADQASAASDQRAPEDD